MKKLLLIILSLAACTEDPQMLVSHDAGVINYPDAEVTDADTPPDASTIEPDAGVPARTFLTKRMFGEGPVNNLVFDPSFDLASNTWYAFSADFAEYLPLQKHLRHSTPTREAAVRVLKNSNRGGILYGNAGSEAGPLAVSVWVGRDVADVELLGDIGATIVAIGLDGPEVAFDLSADESSTMERDGIVWMRLNGMVTDALGTLAFLVADREREPFWVSAPSVLPLPERGGLSLSGRSLTEVESLGIRRVEIEKRRQADPRRRTFRPRSL
jgi:hypothetical protein